MEKHFLIRLLAILLLGALMLAVSLSIAGPADGMGERTVTLKVDGLKSDRDAVALDTEILKQEGIVKSKTYYALDTGLNICIVRFRTDVNLDVILEFIARNGYTAAYAAEGDAAGAFAKE